MIFSNLFGFCKLRIYEDNTIQKSKSAEKDNEIFVLSFVRVTYWAYCSVTLFGLSNTLRKHSDSEKSSFKFEDKCAILNNHMKLWLEKNLVGFSINPKEQEEISSSNAVFCLGSQTCDDEVLLLYECLW